MGLLRLFVEDQDVLASELNAIVEAVNALNTSPRLLGSGELLGARTANPPAAHTWDLREGTLAEPTKLGVSASISRTDATTRAEVNTISKGTDGSDGATAFRSSIKGAAGSQVQVSAGVFSAWQTGESNGGEGSADACALYGFARVTNNAVGRAIGGYYEVRRETTTSSGSQCYEIRSYNGTGINDVYNPAGASTSMGFWGNASGTGASAVYSQVGNLFGQPFHTGYAVGSGAVTNAAFREDTNSEFGLLLKGKHTGGSAIRIEAPIAEVVENVIQVKGPTNTAFTADFKNGNGGFSLFVSGGTGNFLTGTGNGDTGIRINPSGKVFHIGTSGGSSLFRINNEGVAVNGNAPVAKAGAITTLSNAASGTEIATAVNALISAVKNFGITA